jgi:hypothetical protein
MNMGQRDKPPLHYPRYGIGSHTDLRKGTKLQVFRRIENEYIIKLDGPIRSFDGIWARVDVNSVVPLTGVLPAETPETIPTSKIAAKQEEKTLECPVPPGETQPAGFEQYASPEEFQQAKVAGERAKQESDLLSNALLWLGTPFAALLLLLVLAWRLFKTR